MNCISNLIAFIVTLVLLLIVGGTTGARYAIFREVKCVNYVACPSVGDNLQADPYGNNDQCMTIEDRMGLVSIGSMENSSPLGSVPEKCWTDGTNITIYDPYEVMFWSLISVVIIVGVYIIIQMIYSFCSKKSENEDIACVACQTEFLFAVIVALLIAFFIAMFVVLGSFDLTYRKVTCTGYVVNMQDGPWPSATKVSTNVDSVSWKDAFGNSGTNKLLGISYQPSFLPADCWIDSSSVTFYNPKMMYGYISIVFGCIFGPALLFCLIIEFCHQHSPAQPVAPIEMSAISYR
ncbi:MAG: hypothetical protein Hyperionvirus3_127 [Hyperionvirus sp.]|uniref:Uncharacterized protein n=1 Tax=Hyperionvirus sp. TaxID=2487770 RepID=A0A3G5A9W0_9VIRU|nr:MAG: hypothetical protein Hyperionvirus3_127 [Hyperionvirus sp.]